MKSCLQNNYMKILHYTIGFAPERTGGLVGYATDLMIEQKRQHHEVFALYPSSQLFFGKKPRIKEKPEKFGIKTFGLVNSLPLALFGGVANPVDLMIRCDEKIFLEFLKTLNPEVIHIHSLIGLHKEFLEAAKRLNIKIVYTTHDYYGLAPIPNFYYNGVSFDEDNSNLAWNIMSVDALSTKKLRIFQSSLYPLVRKWMKKLNKNPKHKAYQEIETIVETTDYNDLKQYYIEMFKLIDKFHFNSSLTQSIYRNNLPFEPKGKVISITNSTIKKHNIKRNEGTKRTVAYIGPDEEYKGYFDFLEFTKKIDLSKYQINTYGHFPNEFAPAYIEQKGRFSQDQLGKVYSEIDYLIIPSRWKETFGLVTLEALSFGVNVFVSENVGAKDLVDSAHRFRTLEEVDLNTGSGVTKRIETLDNHVRNLQNLYLN